MRFLALLAASFPAVAVAQPSLTPPSTPPPSLRDGFTFEASIGPAAIWSAPMSSNEDIYIPSTTRAMSYDVAVGWFVHPRVALAVRLAKFDHQAEDEGRTSELSDRFIGVTAQYWLTDALWLGAGAGLGEAARTSQPALRGLAVDARIGYTALARGEHNVNISAELLSGFYSDYSLHGFGVLLGYQYL